MRYSILLGSCPLMTAQLLSPIAFGDLIQSTSLSGYRPSTKGSDALAPSDYSDLVEYFGAGAVNISAPDAADVTPGWYVVLRCTTPELPDH